MEAAEAVRVTNAVLWRGMLLFTALDAALLLVLWRVVTRKRFDAMRRLLPYTTAVCFAGIWLWAMIVFWDAVYSWVFAAWLRWPMPVLQALLVGAIAWLATRIAPRLPGPTVIAYCLLGGVWGSLGHVWAVFLGIMSKPPMLRGASPTLAVIFAFFEFTLYWCVIVLLSLAVSRRRAPMTVRTAYL